MSTQTTEHTTITPFKATRPGKDWQELLAKVLPPGRLPVPAAGVVVLRFAGSAVAASSFDYQTALMASHGQGPTGAAGTAKVAHANGLYRTIREVLKVVPKDSDVTLSWEEFQGREALYVEVEGYRLAVPHSIAAAVEKVGLDKIENPSILAGLERGPQVEVDVEEFIRSVDRVIPFASKDDVAPVLTCVQIVIEGGKLTVYGTDRFRMARASMPVALLEAGDLGGQASARALIPGKEWPRLKKILAGGEFKLRLYGAQPTKTKEAEAVAMIGDEFEARVLCQEGKYPDLSTLFKDVTVDRVHVLIDGVGIQKAVQVIEALAPRATPMRLVSTEDGDAVRIVATLEDGEVQESPRVDAIVTEAFDIAFKPTYYLSMLKALRAQRVRLSLCRPEPRKAVHLSDASVPMDQVTFEQLIMPLRLPSASDAQR
ncbi:DNA polymerase III subunit beta [Glutamicibacter sp. PS]|uniref:DNA polymerase III subunit beta n=1 Tax=Glutamicibacter sp. PS TaxID=3075634 RepID=UPI0028413FAD|nr:DNA polymerase III subunit beta [Glutamicibacter sp. PS]MDR4533231.1 DNA polymerase III subunit beta [Glutamicibacter sp. PS]